MRSSAPLERVYVIKTYFCWKIVERLFIGKLYYIIIFGVRKSARYRFPLWENNIKIDPPNRPQEGVFNVFASAYSHLTTIPSKCIFAVSR